MKNKIFVLALLLNFGWVAQMGAQDPQSEEARNQRRSPITNYADQYHILQNRVDNLHADIIELKRTRDRLDNHIRDFEKKYKQLASQLSNITGRPMQAIPVADDAFINKTWVLETIKRSQEGWCRSCIADIQRTLREAKDASDPSDEMLTPEQRLLIKSWIDTAIDESVASKVDSLETRFITEPVNAPNFAFEQSMLKIQNNLGEFISRLGAEPRGSGLLEILDRESRPMAQITSQAHGGRLDLFSRADASGVRLGIGASGGGFASFSLESGVRIGYLGGSREKSGMLLLSNARGQELVRIGANPESRGGRAIFYTNSGEVIAEIGTADNGTGIVLPQGADFAEIFPTNRTDMEPGTVVMIASNRRKEEVVVPTTKSYDSRVIGVTCCAENLKPGVIMGHRTTTGSSLKTIAVSIVGQVFVRTNHEGGSIMPGDILVPSSVPGVAMKGKDGTEVASSAIIGKALEAKSMSQLEMDGALVRVLLN